MTESEQQRFEVILEDIQSKLGIVLEGHDALRSEFNRKIDNLQEKQDMFMSLLKGVHDDLGAKIDGVEQRLDAKIDGVENKLSCGMQSMGARLDAKIDGVEQGLRKDVQEMGVRLTGEIRAVGEKVEGHETRITNLEQQAA